MKIYQQAIYFVRVTAYIQVVRDVFSTKCEENYLLALDLHRRGSASLRCVQDCSSVDLRAVDQHHHRNGTEVNLQSHQSLFEIVSVADLPAVLSTFFAHSRVFVTNLCRVSI